MATTDFHKSNMLIPPLGKEWELGHHQSVYMAPPLRRMMESGNLKNAAMENTEFDFAKSTFEQIFEEAREIAKKYPSKANAFLQKYAEYILGAAADIDTKEDAIKRAKGNFGYHAARFDKETIDLMYTVYDCEHPYFGKRPYDLTPEAVWQMAQQNANLHA